MKTPRAVSRGTVLSGTVLGGTVLSGTVLSATLLAALLIAGMALMPALVSAQPLERYKGLTLADVLRVLQSKGLRIVFSSETVTPAMRVASEPRGRSDRNRLDELLAPHGLRALKGPGGTLLVVRVPQKPAGARTPGRAPVAASETPPRQPLYREQVTVEGAVETRQDPGVASETSIARSELGGLRSVLADDPIRAAHALPHVATGNDFQSEFSVRGSTFRHVGVVIDGVATHRLQHTAYGRGNTGSMTMLHGDLLERATLRAGAYPQRYGSTIGAQLGVTLREGSREANMSRFAFSGSSATAVAEGPAGPAARGSWLVSLRQSYRNWPTRGLAEFDRTMFGFTDALTRIVYDVRPRHQMSLSLLGGQSYVDEADGGPPYVLGDGANKTAVVNFGLRSTLGSRAVLSQRAYIVAHEFLNKTEAGDRHDAGHERDASYRADLAKEVSGGLLEAGSHVQHVRGDRSDNWTSAGYVHYRWRPHPRVLIAPGLRLAHSTLTNAHPIGRWVLGELSAAPRWTLNASAGVSHQFPQLEHLEPVRTISLRPEQATHFDVGLGHRVADAFRWQATVYRRDERDVLRQPLAAGQPWENALDGTSHGVELLVERRRARGLSGWVAYSFAKTRYNDVARGETFWADFDQRHGMNLFAAYHLSERSSVALTFRGGSNFPIPAYLEARNGGLFSGVRRNEVRLSPHARLDARASRSFERPGRRLSVYVEVLNVLNRINVGLANGTIASTGEAIGFTERLMPRLPSAGIAFEF